MSDVPSRLRVAVAASDATVRRRLAALVARSGHEVVELTGAPEAILTDDAIDEMASAPVVAIAGEGVGRPAMVAQRLGPDAVGRPVDLRLLRAGKVLALTAIVAGRPSG